MKKYWNIFWKFRKIQFMKMMEYRGDFFFWLIVSIMWTIFQYFFYSLILGNSKSVSGWSYDEIIVLLSFFTMLDAFTWSVFYPNMISYTDAIYEGNLSSLLLLPINSVFIILTQEANYHNVPRFFIGLTILINTLIKMQIELTFYQIILSAIVFITSIIFIYSGWFILATLSFWVEKLKNINEIMPGFRSIYQMPANIYTGITGLIITFIFPLGLVTTLPSEIILGRLDVKLILYFIVFTAIFSKITLSFYNYSIKKYSGIGN